MEYIVLHALFTPLWQRNLLQNIPTHSSGKVSFLEIKIKARAAAWELPTSNRESTIRETMCLLGMDTAQEGTHQLSEQVVAFLQATSPSRNLPIKMLFPPPPLRIWTHFVWKCPSQCWNYLWVDSSVVNSSALGTHTMPEVAQLYSLGFLKHDFITWRVINPFRTLFLLLHSHSLLYTWTPRIMSEVFLKNI